MTERPNPFLYEIDPYTDNPFDQLGVANAGAQMDTLVFLADRARKYEGRLNPVTGRTDPKGTAGRALACLKDPTLRLAFDMMRFTDEAKR